MSQLQYDGIPINSTPMDQRVLEPRGDRRFHWQSALLLESVRRQTFANWTSPYVDVDELARWGFFYLQNSDHVQCVFCQGIVGYWDPGDEPASEHRKHFPRCPFMTGMPTGNVPVVAADSNDPKSQLYSLLNQYHSFKVSATRPHMPTPAYQTDATIVGGSQLAFPQLNTPSSRLATFTRWPQDVGVTADSMAEAGFFSTGLADWVQCFHCGGGLFGWRRGDDPLKDHAKAYPFCPFVRVKRGELTVDVPNINGVVASNRQLTLSQKEAELLLLHPIAKRLVDMGMSKELVKGALKQRLEVRGVLCRAITDALELVFDYEEDQRKKAATNSCHDGLHFPEQGDSRMTTSEPQVQVPVVETSQYFRSATPIPEFPNPQLVTQDHATKLLQEVNALRLQVEKEEQRLLCRLCRKERVAVVFQPCSHLHLCATCARPQDSCTTCGTIIRGTLRPIIG